MVCFLLSKAITGGIMEQKTKFIIIGLIGFCAVCLFLFLQATSSKQLIIRERDDLKTENTTLTSKITQLENELNSNKSKIDSLVVERDKVAADLGTLQEKFELASRTRDELIDKLKNQHRDAPEIVKQEIVVQDTDAYWGAILKAKTDLEMQLTSVRLELRNLQITNESLQRDKGALQLDVNSLRNEKQDLLRQLDYNQKLLDSISQEVVRERNDKVKIQDNFKKIKNENAVLLRQLNSLNSRKSTLDRKLQDLQEGKTTIEKRLTEM
jgi:chromosome segregation ATPase